MLLLLQLKREFGRILGEKTVSRDCTQSFSTKWSEKMLVYGRKTPAAKPIIAEMVTALEEDATHKK